MQSHNITAYTDVIAELEVNAEMVDGVLRSCNLTTPTTAHEVDGMIGGGINCGKDAFNENDTGKLDDRSVDGEIIFSVTLKLSREVTIHYCGKHFKKYRRK